MARKVQVVPYHNDWPERFEAEAGALKKIFGDSLLSIHHFGSTSVPGISAKPIIDILIIVTQIESADALTPRLQELGYTAVGEYGIPGRRFFFKGNDESRSHHLHVYGIGNPHIMRHLVFRDYMRTHPLPARMYSRLKEELARQFPEDMDGYIAGKNAFVKEQEQKALEWWSHQSQLAQSWRLQEDMPKQSGPERESDLVIRNDGGRGIEVGRGSEGARRNNPGLGRGLGRSRTVVRGRKTGKGE